MNGHSPTFVEFSSQPTVPIRLEVEVEADPEFSAPPIHPIEEDVDAVVEAGCDYFDMLREHGNRNELTIAAHTAMTTAGERLLRKDPAAYEQATAQVWGYHNELESNTKEAA